MSIIDCMRLRQMLIVVAFALVSLAVVWLPFVTKVNNFWGISFGKSGMQTIVQNFDGLNFLVVARSWYDPKIVKQNFSQLVAERGERYFAAHYPLLPAVISVFDLFTSGPNALLMAIVASNILLAIGLYIFFKEFAPGKNPIWLSLISLYFPARMMAVRSIGSNEPLFIFFILCSLLAYHRGRNWWAAALGSLAVLTRSPGILLFAAYLTAILVSKDSWKSRLTKLIPYLLIPTTMIGLFVFEGVRLGDFWAYFKVGGNINLYFPPFMVFGSDFPWVSGHWLEDIVYTYAFYTAGIALYFDKVRHDQKRSALGWFGLIYLTTTFFIVHRDVARYSLPIIPLVYLGLADYLPSIKSKYAKVVIAILMVPVILYAWNFILGNVQPIADWTPFL